MRCDESEPTLPFRGRAPGIGGGMSELEDELSGGSVDGARTCRNDFKLNESSLRLVGHKTSSGLSCLEEALEADEDWDFADQGNKEGLFFEGAEGGVDMPGETVSFGRERVDRTPS